MLTFCLSVKEQGADLAISCGFPCFDPVFLAICSYSLLGQTRILAGKIQDLNVKSTLLNCVLLSYLLGSLGIYGRYTCDGIRIFRPLTKREVSTVRNDSSEASTTGLNMGRDLLQD